MVLKNPLNYDNFHCPILNGNTCSRSKPCLLLKYFTFTVILGTLPIDQKAFTRISAIIQTCSFKNGHHITHIPLEDTPDVSPTVYEGISSFVVVLGKFGVSSQGPCGQNHWKKQSSVHDKCIYILVFNLVDRIKYESSMSQMRRSSPQGSVDKKQLDGLYIWIYPINLKRNRLYKHPLKILAFCCLKVLHTVSKTLWPEPHLFCIFFIFKGGPRPSIWWNTLWSGTNSPSSFAGRNIWFFLRCHTNKSLHNQQIHLEIAGSKQKLKHWIEENYGAKSDRRNTYPPISSIFGALRIYDECWEMFGKCLCLFNRLALEASYYSSPCCIWICENFPKKKCLVTDRST